MNSRAGNPRNTQDDAPEPLGALDALRRQPDLAELAAELAWRASASESAAGFVAQGLPLVAATVSGGVRRRGRAGRRPLASRGRFRPPGAAFRATCWPRPWIAKRAIGNAGWFAAPLAAHAASNELLVLFAPSLPSGGAATRENRGAGGRAGRGAGRRAHARARAAPHRAAWKRFCTIASQWNQTNEMEPLLVQMAEAATRAARGRSGQHLSVGPAEPHARRPAGAWA